MNPARLPVPQCSYIVFPIFTWFLELSLWGYSKKFNLQSYLFDGDLKASGTLTIQEEGVATGSIEYQKMQIKLGGKLSGDIKISDKIQSIKTEKKQSEDDNAVSLQGSITTEQNK